MAILDKIKIVLPKFKGKKQSTSTTKTFKGNDQVLTAPNYRDHLDDIFDSRLADNSQDLMENLFITDPDVSSAVNAYLTVANTQPNIRVFDIEGQEDVEGRKLVETIIQAISTVTDYSLKFQRKDTLKSIAEGFRYMVLLRGALGVELVFDKFLFPTELRNVDMATVMWKEKNPGVYKPEQEQDSGDPISLDIPNFFVQYYRQNPTNVYAYSPFVSSINTIASRQQVINDLYRIMQKTGYPRIEVKIIEEVLIKNAPESVKADSDLQRKWVAARMTDITNQVNNIRADSAIVHTDASEMTLFNEGGPKQSMDVTAIITVLNSANQAALKIMGTIIGRGESGVNTASVEARIFTMNADELNQPVADILSQILTFALRVSGSESTVQVDFTKAEMRPDLELETHVTLKSTRLKQDLSLGIISDEYYHREIYNRPKPDDAPELSGTGFLEQQEESTDIDASKASPNSDPLGRSIAPKESGKATRSNNKGS